MAAMSAAQLLDELMGRDRNLAPTEKGQELDWGDSQVCKHFLVRFCPHELFINTKADLGPCDKIHDERIRDSYKNSKRYESMGYEEDFVRFAQSMITDVERRIKRGRQRLLLTQQENATPKPQAKDNEEKIVMLTEKINSLLEQVETLGCEGKVEEAQGIMKLCDQLKEDRETLRRGGDSNQGDYSGITEKQMEVCEVCGAFLIVGDAQQRLDDHLMGRQHCGYAMLRTTIEEVSSRLEEKKEEREKQRGSERDERRKKDGVENARDTERQTVNNDRHNRNSRGNFRRDDYRRKKSRSRSRDRHSRHFDNYSRDRRRSRSRDRNRRDYGNRNRNRYGSYNSKPRHYRGRSRSKSRERRYRPRSREHRRSKSRDHHRSRSRDRYSSRSRDRHRSKSSERSRRSKDKRRRSRSKDSYRRSKSDDRSRSKSRSNSRSNSRSSSPESRSKSHQSKDKSKSLSTDRVLKNSKLNKDGENPRVEKEDGNASNLPDLENGDRMDIEESDD